MVSLVLTLQPRYETYDDVNHTSGALFNSSRIYWMLNGLLYSRERPALMVKSRRYYNLNY